MLFVFILLIILICLFVVIWYISFIQQKNKSNDIEKEYFIPRKVQKSLMEYYSDTIENKKTNIDSFAKFPKYFINLDSSTIRHDYIKQEFLKHGLEIPKRIAAINGHLLSDLKKGRIDDISYRVDTNETYTGTELACTLSHLVAILQAMNDGHDLAIIFEDDVSLELMNYWEINLETLLDHAYKENKNWEIIHLSAMQLVNSIHLPFEFLKKIQHYIACTTAYLINKRGMDTILSKFMPKNKHFHIRYVPISDDLLYRHAKTLIPNRIYFIPFNDKDKLDSLIHTDHTSHHLDLSFKVSKFMLKRTKHYPLNRVVHQVWFTFDEKSPHRFEKMQQFRETCLEANKEWTFLIWNEVECLDLVKSYLPWLLDRYISYKDKIFQVDTMKYILPYLFGGAAMDMDIICLKKMDTLLENHDLVFVEQYKDMITNDFIYSSKPNHPLLEYILAQLMNIKSKNVIESTGPVFLQNCLSVLKTHFSDFFHIVPYKYTHPFPWYEYTNKCHSKNKNFNIESCIHEYNKDSYPVMFLTVYNASWHNNNNNH